VSLTDFLQNVHVAYEEKMCPTPVYASKWLFIMAWTFFCFVFETFRNHPFLSCRKVPLPLGEVCSKPGSGERDGKKLCSCGCREGRRSLAKSGGGGSVMSMRAID